MKIKLLLVNKKYRNNIIEAVNEMLTDFPILNNLNIVIHMRKLDRRLGNSFASHRNIYSRKRIIHEIKLNPKAFFFLGIEKKLESVMDANYANVKDIIWHELGHVLQIYMLMDDRGIEPDKFRYTPQTYYEIFENNEMNAWCFCQHMQQQLSTCRWNKGKAEKLLGGYAVHNSYEFIPECFNNYYRLRNIGILDDYEQETFQFVKMVVDDYKNIIEKVTRSRS